MATQCNRCFYEIQWNKDLAMELFDGKNKPFEPGTQKQHQCKTPARPGWGIGSDGKIGIINMSFLSDADKKMLEEKQNDPKQTKLPSATSINNADIQSKLDKIIKQQEALATAFTETVRKQNEDIFTLKTIIDQWTEHNPYAASFERIIARILETIPSETLTKPVTADQLIDTTTTTEAE